MNPHQRPSASLSALALSFVRNRHLITQMAKREVIGRYRGSALGLAWSFFNPLIMLAVYTFLFSFVFKARWGISPHESHGDFAIMLFAGLFIHSLFAECFNRAPHLILGNVNYVKKVVFPLEILPWVAVSSALFHALISLLVLLLAQLLIMGTLPWTVILFPLILLPFVLLLMGISWLLAATCVYVRDIAHVTGVFTSILLFVSPVFFPITALPENLQWAIYLNPITLIIEQSRAVLILGQVPNFLALGVYSLISLATAWLGFWWFQRLRGGFADVL